MTCFSGAEYTQFWLWCPGLTELGIIVLPVTKSLPRVARSSLGATTEYLYQRGTRPDLQLDAALLQVLRSPKACAYTQSAAGSCHSSHSSWVPQQHRSLSPRAAPTARPQAAGDQHAPARERVSSRYPSSFPPSSPTTSCSLSGTSLAGAG